MIKVYEDGKYSGNIRQQKFKSDYSETIKQNLTKCIQSTEIWKKRLELHQATLKLNDAVWGFVERHHNTCRLCIEMKNYGICLTWLEGHPFESFLKIVQCFDDDEISSYEGKDALIQLAIKYRKTGELLPLIHNQDFIDRFYYLYKHVNKREKIQEIYKFILKNEVNSNEKK